MREYSFSWCDTIQRQQRLQLDNWHCGKNIQLCGIYYLAQGTDKEAVTTNKGDQMFDCRNEIEVVLLIKEIRENLVFSSSLCDPENT